MRQTAIAILVFILGIGAIICAQFCQPLIFGADGYLHIRMSQFITQYGARYPFHWARYSVFAQHFADKDFLYHIFLIPFSFFKDIFFAAKASAAVMAVFLYAVFFWMLRRYCQARFLIPFFLAVFLCSAPFLRALSEPRNMTLIIALTLLFTHLLIQKRSWALFVLCLVYTLAHVSGPYLILFALLAEAARFAGEQEFRWQSVLATLLGVLAGFLLHPNFPNNFRIFYLNGILVPIFALKWGLELGAEFFPASTRDWALDYPFILLSLILMLALSTSAGNKIKASTRIWMSLAGFFFVFSFFSRRYLAHLYPLLLVALAGYASDWWGSGERLPFFRRRRAWRISSVAVLTMALAMVGFFTARSFRRIAQADEFYNRHYEAVGRWMAENVPAGEVIFHSNWSDAQYFIGLNPKDDYFVTLDPIFMYCWNPVKYKLYRDISFGSTSDPYSLLKNEFGVRYGYCGKYYFSGLLNQVRSDPRFQILAEDGMGIVFKLK